MVTQTLIWEPSGTPDGSESLAQVRVGSTWLLSEPPDESSRETQVLFGEIVTVLEHEGEWAKVRAHLDGQEGYVEALHLSPPRFEPTHWVCVPHTLVTKERAVQSPVVMDLWMNARVHISDEARDEEFVYLTDAGWVSKHHVRRIGDFETDPVNVAFLFYRRPYLWGGRTDHGLDCSALIQTAFLACGKACPRNAREQVDIASKPLGCSKGLPPLRRGDLVFFEGHVLMMLEPQTVIHATANVMAVVMEDLSVVIERYRKKGKEVIAVRRP